MKQGAIGDASRAAIKKFDEVLLPQYAIKEFKAGALRNYVWFHNRVVISQTWTEAVKAIGSLLYQHNKRSTALEALADFSSSLSKAMPAELYRKYPSQNMAEIMKREARIWLQTTILRAWRRRRTLATAVVSPLPCYEEKDALRVRSNGTIDDKPVACSTHDCCLREAFAARGRDVESLLLAAEGMPDKNETVRRRAVLRQLHKHADRPISDDQCRYLGDAVFAMQCPENAQILTTNVKDHQPLANAIGVGVVTP